MRLGAPRWFATLRARKHAVLCILLPALALSAAAGPACAAMAPATEEPAAVHDHGGGHDGHEAGVQPAPESDLAPTVCPHCPLEAGSAAVGHASCTIADAQTSEAAYAENGGMKAPPPIMDSRLPAILAVPPLIAKARSHTDPLTATVALTLRYCVLLI